MCKSERKAWQISIKDYSKLIISLTIAMRKWPDSSNTLSSMASKAGYAFLLFLILNACNSDKTDFQVASDNKAANDKRREKAEKEYIASKEAKRFADSVFLVVSNKTIDELKKATPTTNDTTPKNTPPTSSKNKGKK